MIFHKFPKKLQLTHIGGQDEIGKNMTALKYGNNIILIDCGMKFPDESMPGIDKVIPDMTYIRKNKGLVRALFLTHGHEDHIGAIPYLLKEVNLPIYGTKLTLGLVEHKLKEAKLLKQAKLHTVKPRQVVNLGPFSVEFLRVCHSIPDAVALSIKTPVGRVFHTGDFKIDYTPIDGEQADLQRFGEIGTEGVLLLMSDSTNADSHGSTPSERTVGESFDKIFAAAKGRIIVASFASNIHRLQQAIDTAVKHGRKVTISGLSMQNVIEKARDLGYLKMPKDVLIKLDHVNQPAHHNIVILTTGSQGEPMSALSRMVKGEHKQIKIRKGDTVVISAIPIPGNEKSVYKTIDGLFKLGAEVIYEERHDIHVSGHGCQEEMKLMLNLIKPKYFVPVHGEYHHLVAHAKLARENNVKPENIFLDTNGDSLDISRDKISRSSKIEIADVYVDGSEVGDVGAAVLSERLRLADDGIMIVSVSVSKREFRPVSDVRIETKGLGRSAQLDELMKRSKDITSNVIKRHFRTKAKDLGQVKHEIQKEIGKLIEKNTERRPFIIPVIIQV